MSMQLKFKNYFHWILFGGVTVFLLWYFLFVAKFQKGGDVIEYFGVSESLMNHGGVLLSQVDKDNLSNSLGSGYFELPGYYIYGRGGDRYPVHFFFYSIFLIPLRLILRLFDMDELISFSLLNVLILVGSVGLIFKLFVKNNYKRVVLFFSVFLSPLVFFLKWPGPDIYYLCLVLISVFSFFNKNYLLACILLILASWHSQPLMILAGLFSLWFFVKKIKLIKHFSDKYIGLDEKIILIMVGLFVLVIIPFIYNYYAFTAWSPWISLEDGWTKIYGFGLHNASLKKLWEQVFDLNIGQFWYAPLIVGAGIYEMFKSSLKIKSNQFFVVSVILTAFFYQTNPAWHYGTSGYGPGRHGLFLLPVFIYFFVKWFADLKFLAWKYGVVFIFLIIQLFNLSMNGWLEPNLEKTHFHNVYAKFVLNYLPHFYNPTPEIFVDRTNHTDLDYPTSAVYLFENRCRKAYVLKNDVENVSKQCGIFPSRYEKKFEQMEKFEGMYIYF